MKIGIDFDNTIANYEGVFYAAALELGLIDASVGTTKNEVRDHLNGSGRKDAFTELQGTVYGSRMDLANVYDGFLQWVQGARNAGHALYIVSHKTRYPMLGARHDMHNAARGFLQAHGIASADMIAPENIFFEETKEAKADRAASLGVSMFVDDLPGILDMPQFAGMQRVLFDPADAFVCREDIPHQRVGGWADIAIP